MGKTVKKRQSHKKHLRNTKNKLCKTRKFTACCPHMTPDNNGRYATTATKHVLKYNRNKYRLMTCCQMCGDAMNSLARENPKKFAKLYIDHIDKKGNIHAKNRHTGKVVQILRLIE
tara:strand:- start:389 stop:736 length:348 start_codon:yes stop_codon:yes gene_type:complete